MTNSKGSNSPAPVPAELISKTLAGNTFHKRERLRGSKNFDLLVEKGKSFHEGFLRVCWSTSLPVEEITFPVMAAFAIPKRRVRKATKRNSIRRKIREAYRKKKNSLISHCIEKKKSLAVLFIFNRSQEISFTEAESVIEKILNRLREKI